MVSALLLTLWLLPKKANPRDHLNKADTLTEQNLCLMAILEQEPQQEDSWRQLLINYLVLDADPLTIEATKRAAEAAVGHAITLPESVNVQPEERGSVIGTGGIVHAGCKATDYQGANNLVTDGETVYLATNNGIEVDYHGLRIPLTSAKAKRMIAAENGLYYLNTAAKRVQYLARDGHRTETLSSVAATDFAYLNNSLWIAGTDGILYQDGTAIKSDYVITELNVAGGALYGRCERGLVRIDKSIELILFSPVRHIVGTEKGSICYIDSNGYPVRFDPVLKEAVILAEKLALAVGYSEDKAYYLNSKLKIKKCGKF